VKVRLISVLFPVIVMVAPVSAQFTAVTDTSFFDDSYRYYDQAIDPESYLIRPGENLIVTFVNTKLPSIALDVGPENKIVNRGLGVFDLTGLNLSEARRLLHPPLTQLYNVDEIDISVGQPYKVSIAVAGAVHSPGLYQGYTSQMVSELITKASGVLPSGSTRRIVLSGGAGDIAVDMDRATYLGDNSANPCLYAGTRVFVPAKSEALVTVVGGVNHPRDIELLPGDDINLILNLAGGAKRMADVEAAYAVGDPERDVTKPGSIKPGDIIVVPHSEQHLYGSSLTIFGAVVRPGRYSYDSEMTVNDLIETAGGLIPNANVSRTTVFRQPVKNEWEVVADFRYPIGGGLVQNEGLSHLPLSPLDSVFVPFMVGYVKVTGQVRNPGYVPYTTGRDALYYVNLTGGYAGEADRKEVLVFNRVAGTSYLSPPDVIINDGDEIIVRRIMEEQ
jgi:protein involved in polysaccharide export with SLBB domain